MRYNIISFQLVNESIIQSVLIILLWNPLSHPASVLGSSLLAFTPAHQVSLTKGSSSDRPRSWMTFFTHSLIIHHCMDGLDLYCPDM